MRMSVRSVAASPHCLVRHQSQSEAGYENEQEPEAQRLERKNASHGCFSPACVASLALVAGKSADGGFKGDCSTGGNVPSGTVPGAATPSGVLGPVGLVMASSKVSG